MDPSGTFVQFDAKAIGSGSEGAQQSLQEVYHKVLILTCTFFITLLYIIKADMVLYLFQNLYDLRPIHLVSVNTR